MWVRDRVSTRMEHRAKDGDGSQQKEWVLEVNVIQPYFPQQETKDSLGQSSSLLKCILAQEDHKLVACC